MVQIGPRPAFKIPTGSSASFTARATRSDARRAPTHPRAVFNSRDPRSTHDVADVSARSQPLDRGGERRLLADQPRRASAHRTAGEQQPGHRPVRCNSARSSSTCSNREGSQLNRTVASPCDSTSSCAAHADCSAASVRTVAWPVTSERAAAICASRAAGLVAIRSINWNGAAPSSARMSKAAGSICVASSAATSRASAAGSAYEATSVADVCGIGTSLKVTSTMPASVPV